MDFEIKNVYNELNGSEEEIDEDELNYEEEITELEAEVTQPDDEADAVRPSYFNSYFRESKPDNIGIRECKICNAEVSIDKNTLYKHLKSAHNINKHFYDASEFNGRGRPSRSFIWKYCSRENRKQALCHLCNKFLFFGGGNTSNIAKHLRRKHSEVLDPSELGHNERVDDNSFPDNSNSADNSNDRKDKKVISYVWKYCEKIEKQSVRCRLCNKVMSFHGTANVITHLARRHRINGKDEKDNNGTEEEPFELVTYKPGDKLAPLRKGRGVANPCNVWKYCRKLSKDVVRCEFCKKNLSYQGTSNLQRHLQRMHGISKGIKPIPTNEIYLRANNPKAEVFWEFCEKFDERQAKCTICNFVCSMDVMREHMVQKHAVTHQNIEHTTKLRKIDYEETSEDEDDPKELEEENCNNSVEMDEAFKEDVMDEIIEIDPEPQENDEDIFGSNIELTKDSVDSMSSKSSGSYKPKKIISREDSPRIKKLREALVLSETEYFREKAGYYRMQKYLSALQAKKIRIELESFNTNSVPIGATYTINTSSLSENITQIG